MKFKGFFIVGCLLLALVATLGGSHSQVNAADVSSQQVERVPGRFLTGPNQGAPLDIALNYLAENYTAFGLTQDDISNYVIASQYYDDSNGITHIFLQQQHEKIGVHNGILNIHIAKDGSVITVGNRFVSDLAQAANTTQPVIAALDAVSFAADSLGLTAEMPTEVLETKDGATQEVIFVNESLSLKPIPAKLVYQPMLDGTARLAWDVEIFELSDVDKWSIRIDAVTGEEVDRFNYVIHDEFGHGAEDAHEAEIAEEAAEDNLMMAPDSYRVYAMPVESPNHGGRTLEVNPANGTASPFGWHDTNGVAGAEFTVTRGNNVHAYEDGNNPGFSPNGGASLDFDFPINLAQHPNNYEAAAITNLFYWNNIIHDVLYQYGFDEASGNFQENNYGNGGAGSDSVNAEAQDGGGMNNANFYTPADGSNPRMQMYLWNITNPHRDGDLDNGIIIHEYGHGISNRLTGGPANVGCLSTFSTPEQAGEGWSDWYAIMLTMNVGDTGAQKRGVGTYALGQPTNGDGIRDYPYSTDMAIDPRTYDEIKTAAVPHGVGSTWAAMLWEMNWALIDVYGFDADFYNGTGGNNIALELVTDGMKLQPCSPGFVDARDAILLADQNNNGGANECTIWEAFAKRGLGYSADQGLSSSRSDGTEAFDLPPQCSGGGGGTTGTLYFDWNCDGSYSSVAVTFNNDGTFSSGSSGKWSEVEDFILWQYDNSNTTYAGNTSGIARAGIMSTFSGLEGCWYLVEDASLMSLNGLAPQGQEDSHNEFGEPIASLSTNDEVNGTPELMAPVTGAWTLYFDWNCDGSYSSTSITFNAGGTFNAGLTGKWTQLEGMMEWKYDSFTTAYAGNVLGDAMVGSMSTFSGSEGCWYALRGGSRAPHVIESSDNHNAVGELIREATAAPEAPADNVLTSVVGTWTMYYDWGCNGGYGSATFTFNNNGTFSSGSYTGNWDSLEGNVIWQYATTNKTTYEGNVSGGAMVGLMSTFSGLQGCWYAIQSGSLALDAIDSAEGIDMNGYTDNIEKLREAKESQGDTLDFSPVGSWTLYFDWNCDGSYFSTTLTFNANGTFNGTAGKWIETEGMALWRYNSGTGYGGNGSGKAMVGISSTFSSFEGCWYALQNNSLMQPTAPIDFAPISASGEIL